MASGSERSSTGSVVVVLIVLLAVVAWNHERNRAAESQAFRPYRTYSEAELAALIEAYEPAAEAAGARYESAVGRRAEARGTGDIQGNVRELERVQAVARAAREARGEYASARSDLEALRKEKVRRAGERSTLRTFLRRAFTF